MRGFYRLLTITQQRPGRGRIQLKSIAIPLRLQLLNHPLKGKFIVGESSCVVFGKPVKTLISICVHSEMEPHVRTWKFSIWV